MHPPKPSPCGPIVGNRWDRCRYLKPMCICSGNENLGNSQWWNVTVICSCAVLGAVFVLFVHSDFSYCSSWLTIQNISIIMNILPFINYSVCKWKKEEHHWHRHSQKSAEWSMQWSSNNVKHPTDIWAWASSEHRIMGLTIRPCIPPTTLSIKKKHWHCIEVQFTQLWGTINTNVAAFVTTILNDISILAASIS